MKLTMWGKKGYRCNNCGSGRLKEIFTTILKCLDCGHEETKRQTKKK